jgi:hypothetical protein
MESGPCINSRSRSPRISLIGLSGSYDHPWTHSCDQKSRAWHNGTCDDWSWALLESHELRVEHIASKMSVNSIQWEDSVPGRNIPLCRASLLLWPQCVQWGMHGSCVPEGAGGHSLVRETSKHRKCWICI